MNLSQLAISYLSFFLFVEGMKTEARKGSNHLCSSLYKDQTITLLSIKTLENLIVL
jgi:hypothetical protein